MGGPGRDTAAARAAADAAAGADCCQAHRFLGDSCAFELAVKSVKRRLIQVGVGGWGASYLQRVLLSTSWELVAVVGRGDSALAAARASHGIERQRCFTSLTEAAAAYEADAALIVVPSAIHLPIASEAFKAGLHVLIEKPLADTMGDAQEIVSQARRAGKTLMVSQNYRYRAAARIVAHLLRQGWLGAVGAVTLEYRKAPLFARPPVPHGYSGFRMIEDLSIHHFDQLRGVLGLEPQSVFSQARNPAWSWFAAPSVVNAVIEMEGGALVDYFASWISRGRQTTWDGSWCIDCAHGVIEWADNRVRVRPEEVYYTVDLPGFTERNGWMEAEFHPSERDARDYILDEFARCLDDGRVPETDGQDNLRSLALAFAAAGSVRAGEPQLIADYLGTTGRPPGWARPRG